MARWSKYNIFINEDDEHVLLFNTRTGALVRLDSTRKHQIKEPSEIRDDFLSFLLKQGFLVEDDIDELELISNTHESARNNIDMFSATIELTEACNFKCLYCYQTHSARHMQNHVLNKVMNYLSRKIKNVKHLHINWFGGEPLIQFKVLKRISQQLQAEANIHGCSFSQYITTNGYLITPSIAKELSAIGIKNVQITLDGDEVSHNHLRVHRSGKGTYQRVLSACRFVVEAGMELLVRINLNRWNLQHIPGLLADIISKGISPVNTTIHVTRVVDHGNLNGAISSAIFSTEEFAREWINILKVIVEYGFNLPSLDPIAYNCPFDLKQTVMIGSDGSIRHCSSSNQPIAYLADTGEEVKLMDRYRTVKERRPVDDLQCKECLYLPICMGGCSYLQEIGEEKCMPERYVLPELVKLWAEQAKNHRKGGEINGTGKNITGT